MTTTPHPPLTPLQLLETEAVVTVTQAARILGVSRGHAYALAESGELPTRKVGSRILVPTVFLRDLVSLS